MKPHCKAHWIVLLVTITLLNCTGLRKEPLIAFDAQDYDFGTVKRSQSIVGAFKIKNQGDAPLTIKKVYFDCGVARISYPKGSIEPNSTAKITFIYNTSVDSGQVVKRIGLESNTREVFSFLTISGEVNP